MTKTMPKPTEPVSTEMSAVKTASEVIHLALEKSEKMLPEGEYLKLANALKKANEDLTKNRKSRGMKMEGMEIRGEGTLTGSPVSAKLVFLHQEMPDGAEWKKTETWELSVGDEPPVAMSGSHDVGAFLQLHEPYTLKVSGVGPTFTIKVPNMVNELEAHNDEETEARGWDENDFWAEESCVYNRIIRCFSQVALNKLVRAFPTHSRDEV